MAQADDAIKRRVYRGTSRRVGVNPKALETKTTFPIPYSVLNLTGTIVNADVAAGAAIVGTKINPDVTNAIIGVAAGYNLARGETAVTGTADIATGLTTVVQAVACLETDPSLEALWASVADSVTGGNIVLKVWKPTGAADCTPIAATVAKSVRWIAVGT